jgi:WD40 repeat protein
VATVEGYIGGITEVYDPFEPGEWRWEVLEGIPGVLYAVPSSGDNVLLPGDGSTGVVPVVRASGANQVRPVLPGFSPKLRWIADIPIPAEDRGSLPEIAGAQNGGLRGSIYFDDDGLGDTTATHVVDLQNATDQVLFNLTDDDLDNVSDLVYVSRDGQYVSHHYDDTFKGAIFIKDHLGRHLMGISTETDSYDMGVNEAVRFSPVDANLILVSYTDFYDNNVSYLDETVSVIDWTVPGYTKHYFDREYVSADWTPNGDIVLAGADGNIYLASVDGREFSDPVLHISTRDSITNLAVSPDGTRIAYTMNRHIWVSDFDGGSFRRLTGFAEHFNMLPEWSPDSSYIAFKQLDDDDGPNDYGRLWVVAADSADVQVRGIADTPNAVPLQTGEKQLGVFGCFSWR